MNWPVELAHEVGHICIGIFGGGTLRNASSDPQEGSGDTQFDFPPSVKTATDLDRLTFVKALYDVGGIAGEMALCGHVVDPQRSADDLTKFQKTYEAHRHTVFWWAHDRDMAEVVMAALAEQAVRDHLELATHISGQLKAFNAIIHTNVLAYGRLPQPLAPGADWASWFTSTAQRASEWLHQENDASLQRAIFDARQRQLMEQIRLTQGV